MNNKFKYIAFLRGINVGGHHKVPMAELKSEFQNLGFENIVTILNSGNIIFETTEQNINSIENKIAKQLEKKFGFSIPTIVCSQEMISSIYLSNPFENIELTKDIRLYISFLKTNLTLNLDLPWENEDHSFKILNKTDRIIISILDLSKSNTPKAMEILEKTYGSDITTRNWNTIERIIKKL